MVKNIIAATLTPLSSPMASPWRFLASLTSCSIVPPPLALIPPNSSTHYAGEHQLFASQSDVHLAAQSSIAVATSDGASLYATDDGTKIMANHGSVSLQADKDATITSAGSSIEVLDVSVQIMMLGMKDGLFRSGHTLSKCLDDEDDYFNARLIINEINNGTPDK